jgi:hypothetical protein
MAVALEGKEKLAQAAETICYNPPLAEMLGEIFDIIGEYGHLEIRSGRSRELEREYVEGMYWDGGVIGGDGCWRPRVAALSRWWQILVRLESGLGS